MSARRPMDDGAPDDNMSSTSSPAVNPAPVPESRPHAEPSTRKEAPPEKPSDIRRRTYVILSFWLIVLCLGLPIWWNTTTIYRANMPLDDMLDWADGKVWTDQSPYWVVAELTILLPGLSPRLPSAHLHTSRCPPGSRGPESPAIDPACPRRP